MLERSLRYNILFGIAVSLRNILHRWTLQILSLILLLYNVALRPTQK